MKNAVGMQKMMIPTENCARRGINGFLLLDKPKNISSNAALQRVKRLFQAKKAGHMGSLDPLATGMLPIGLGEATKFSQFLLEADKTYWVKARLGIVTTTGDAEGEVLSERDIPSLAHNEWEALLQRFLGAQQQIPPMFSALKYQGRPLYQLARQGIEVERQPRTITVFSIQLVEFDADSVTFTLRCSKGTYVRTLVVDLGEIIGCGAHVIELRRLEVGSFLQSQMISLDTLEEQSADMTKLDQHLVSLERVLMSWPAVTLSSLLMRCLKQGQAIAVPNLPAVQWMRLLLPNGRFVGMGTIQEDGKLAPWRMMAADF